MWKSDDEPEQTAAPAGCAASSFLETLQVDVDASVDGSTSCEVRDSMPRRADCVCTPHFTLSRLSLLCDQHGHSSYGSSTPLDCTQETRGLQPQRIDTQLQERWPPTDAVLATFQGDALGALRFRSWSRLRGISPSRHTGPPAPVIIITMK